MVVDVVEVIGELHVVAKHGLEHVLTIAGDWELDSLEVVGCQRENITQVIDVVKRNSVFAHEGFGSAKPTDASQQRERDMTVKPSQGPYSFPFPLRKML